MAARAREVSDDLSKEGVAQIMWAVAWLLADEGERASEFGALGKRVPGEAGGGGGGGGGEALFLLMQAAARRLGGGGYSSSGGGGGGGDKEGEGKMEAMSAGLEARQLSAMHLCFLACDLEQRSRAGLRIPEEFARVQEELAPAALAGIKNACGTVRHLCCRIA